MKPNISASNSLFKTHKSYTPEEILSAGGTTAFGLRMGKDRDSLIKALEKAPKPEPFTDEEWVDLMDDLEKDR
jgi:hypothetical protein